MKFNEFRTALATFTITVGTNVESRDDTSKPAAKSNWASLSSEISALTQACNKIFNHLFNVQARKVATQETTSVEDIELLKSTNNLFLTELRKFIPLIEKINTTLGIDTSSISANINACIQNYDGLDFNDVVETTKKAIASNKSSSLMTPPPPPAPPVSDDKEEDAEEAPATTEEEDAAAPEEEKEATPVENDGFSNFFDDMPTDAASLPSAPARKPVIINSAASAASTSAPSMSSAPSSATTSSSSASTSSHAAPLVAPPISLSPPPAPAPKLIITHSTASTASTSAPSISSAPSSATSSSSSASTSSHTSASILSSGGVKFNPPRASGSATSASAMSNSAASSSPSSTSGLLPPITVSHTALTTGLTAAKHPAPSSTAAASTSSSTPSTDSNDKKLKKLSKNAKEVVKLNEELRRAAQQNTEISARFNALSRDHAHLQQAHLRSLQSAQFVEVPDDLSSDQKLERQSHTRLSNAWSQPREFNFSEAEITSVRGMRRQFNGNENAPIMTPLVPHVAVTHAQHLEEEHRIAYATLYTHIYMKEFYARYSQELQTLTLNAGIHGSAIPALDAHFVPYIAREITDGIGQIVHTEITARNQLPLDVQDAAGQTYDTVEIQQLLSNFRSQLLSTAPEIAITTCEKTKAKELSATEADAIAQTKKGLLAKEAELSKMLFETVATSLAITSGKVTATQLSQISEAAKRGISQLPIEAVVRAAAFRLYNDKAQSLQTEETQFKISTRRENANISTDDLDRLTIVEMIQRNRYVDHAISNINIRNRPDDELFTNDDIDALKQAHSHAFKEADAVARAEVNKQVQSLALEAQAAEVASQAFSQRLTPAAYHADNHIDFDFDAISKDFDAYHTKHAAALTKHSWILGSGYSKTFNDHFKALRHTTFNLDIHALLQAADFDIGQYYKASDGKFQEAAFKSEMNRLINAVVRANHDGDPIAVLNEKSRILKEHAQKGIYSTARNTNPTGSKIASLVVSPTDTVDHIRIITDELIPAAIKLLQADQAQKVVARDNAAFVESQRHEDLSLSRRRQPSQPQPQARPQHSISEPGAAAASTAQINVSGDTNNVAGAGARVSTTTTASTQSSNSKKSSGWTSWLPNVGRSSGKSTSSSSSSAASQNQGQTEFTALHDANNPQAQQRQQQSPFITQPGGSHLPYQRRKGSRTPPDRSQSHSSAGPNAAANTESSNPAPTPTPESTAPRK